MGKGPKKENKKTKRKSIKAKVTSKFSAKRLLSRMGKKVKKGEMGPSTEFITRSSVLKRLQITLKDFRRLCILKGIYPRVPTKAPKGADKIYYDIKDISYLSHEPLLAKFREFKTFMRKIRKAAGRNQFAEARRKDGLKPVHVLDHLVKERYPRFIDALRDMDDALCMIHLFASLPSAGRITVDKTSKCSELARHWQYYIAKSKTLQKVFVSVKGVYFQAEVMGEPITWLVPHQFTQAVPREIDLRVMMTFLEFYEVFIKFALYKLYHMEGLRYPPQLDKKLNDAGCCLLAMKTIPIENSAEASSAAPLVAASVSAPVNAKKLPPSSIPVSTSLARIATLDKKIASLAEEEDAEEDDEDDEIIPIAGALTDAFAALHGTDGTDDRGDDERTTFSIDQDQRSGLFNKLKFFVNREVPLEWMQLCVLAFGAQIGWEGTLSPFTATDPGITHHIVDRPLLGQLETTREYVQPQWVFDSINAQMLLPVHQYRPDAKLPPHLSPFVDDDKEGYLPKYREEIRKLKAASTAGADVAGVAEGVETSKRVVREVEQLDSGDEGEDEEDQYAAEVRAEKAGKKNVVEAGSDSDEEVDGSEEGEDDESSEEVEEEDTKSKQKAEADKIRSSTKGPKGVVYKPKEEKLEEDEELAELAKTMMNKKSKRLYGRMQHGISKKQDEIKKLEDKRKLCRSDGVVDGKAPRAKKQKKQICDAEETTTPSGKKGPERRQIKGNKI